MSKIKYALALFQDIKDNIELDSDVQAILKLLIIMLENDINLAIKNWKYLLCKYDIEALSCDINFDPIVKDFPLILLTHISIEDFFKYFSDMPALSVQSIYNQLFNAFLAECYMYQKVMEYVEQDKLREEESFIKLVIEKSTDFFEGTFDKREFIKRVLLIHIKYNKLTKELSKMLIELMDNAKDKAILKIIIIDYFMF